MPNDLKALKKQLERAKRDTIKAGNKAAGIVARETRDYARRLSSGPFKTDQLRKAGHPYSKWHPHPPIDASVVNKQSGLFQKDWRVENILLSSGQVIFVVRNVAPYARFLEDGTANMIARPMGVRLEFFAARAWDRVAPPIFESAFRNALRG